MRKLILILTMACVQCGPVPVHAIELENGKVVITPREMQALQNCPAAGGCYILTRAALEAMIMRARELTLAEVDKAAPTCRKDDST